MERDSVVGTLFLSFFCSAAATKTPLFTSGDEQDREGSGSGLCFFDESEYI